MASIAHNTPIETTLPGGNGEEARLCFGGPWHGRMVRGAADKKHFSVSSIPSFSYVTDCSSKTSKYFDRIEYTTYFKEVFTEPISDLLYRETFVWMVSGYQFSYHDQDDWQRIMWCLRNSNPKLIPEPNILTDFTLWFRRACYKHRITERIVREVEGVDRGW